MKIIKEDIKDPTPKQNDVLAYFKRIKLIKKFVQKGDHPQHAYVKALNVVKSNHEKEELKETLQRTILYALDRIRRKHKYDSNHKKHEEDKEKIKMKIYEEVNPKKPKLSDAVISSVSKNTLKRNMPLQTNYKNISEYLKKK